MSVTQLANTSPIPYPAIRGVDYVELFVGNVRQAAHYYQIVWQFEPVAFCGLETGSTERTSIVMRQGTLTLLLTGAIRSSTPVAHHLQLHGEGVAAIAFGVADARAAFEAAVKRGAAPIHHPEVLSDEKGQIVRSEVKAVDGYSHIFVDRSEYEGQGIPGFQYLAVKHEAGAIPAITGLDHIAIAVEAGTLNTWVNYYQSVFGFELGQREDVATEKSGMNSRVVQNEMADCRFPIVEPAPGKSTSQVQEFLNFHEGPGVQHLGISTSNIIETIRGLRSKGVEFLSVPHTYYQELEKRVGSLGPELKVIQELNLLVDCDARGQLIQTFARPYQDRPTLFIEVIERRGAKGFGGGNIRALFESIEREQALRGTL